MTTDYSPSHSDTKTIPILTQTHLIILSMKVFHSHLDSQTTPSHCQSESLNNGPCPPPTHWQVLIDTQTTPILTETHLILLSFSLRLTDYSQSLSIWIFKLMDHAHPPPTGRYWLTHRLLPFSHRLLPFSLRHKNYSHSYRDTPNTTFILT